MTNVIATFVITALLWARSHANTRSMNILETTQLCRTFHAHSATSTPVKALDTLSLQVESGQRIALLGSNGAGKSTLINIILNLDVPTSGSVSVCGTTPKNAQEHGLVAHVMQSGGLLPEWTVKETLTALCALRGQSSRLNDIIDRAGVRDFLTRKVRNCSGGQVQRLRLAISLIHPSELLILDEPTAGMDPHARRDLWTQINELHRAGTTILFATHNMEEAARNADHIVILHKGRALAQGNLEHIYTQTQASSLDEAFFALADVSDAQ